MIAVLGGLGAALMWATSTLCSSRSSRMIGAWSVTAWVMTGGLVLNLAILAIWRPAPPTDAATIGWLAVGGAGNLAGLVLGYSALRVGKVSLVTPIVSTEGALAALVAVLAGEPLGVASAALLVVITCGVLLAATAPEVLPVEGERKSLAVGLAVLAALAFGVSLYATGHVSSSAGLGWVLLPPRLMGVVILTVPLALTGRLRLTRRAVPLVLVSGAAEVVGFAAYAVGARHEIAIAAVLASQFAAFTAVGAYVLFRERLSRMQLTGVVIVIVGVAALSAVRA